jgi:hypothetical protein
LSVVGSELAQKTWGIMRMIFFFVSSLVDTV